MRNGLSISWLGRGLAALATCVVATAGLPVAAHESPTQTVETRIAGIEERLNQVAPLETDIKRLERTASLTDGDELRILKTRIENRHLEVLELSHAAVRDLLALEEQGADVGELREPVLAVFSRVPDDLHARLQDAEDALRATDPRGADLTPLQESEILDARHRIVERLDSLYRALLAHVDLGEKLGLDMADERSRLVRALEEAGETTSVFLELARERASSVADRLDMLPGDEDLVRRLAVAQSRVRNAADRLKTLARMLDELGVDTAEYQQQAITATGDLDAAVLDVGLVEHLLATSYEKARVWVADNASRLVFKVVLVLLVLLAAWAVARVAGRLVGRTLESGRFEVSQLLARVIVLWVRRLVILLGALIVLAQLGVSVGPLLAGLGVAGFIVGFALQSTLSNFASGLFILFYRPYDVGDAVEAGGVVGKVSSMSLVNTTILTFDNQRIVVPNNKIWGDVIKNITAEDVRRVDLVFGISYGDDIPRAEAVLEEIVRSHDKVLEDPEPVVKLHELADSSVNFIVRPWTRTADYWAVYWDVTREVKLRFDREGISIPFPQRDVHLLTDEAGVKATVA